MPDLSGLAQVHIDLVRRAAQNAHAAVGGVRRRHFNGRVELLIGENGLVTAVKIIERTHPQYDTMLVAAARRWPCSPAVKDGKAVKFRKILEFTLRGR